MTALDILRNSTTLYLILGTLAAIVAAFWLISHLNERRDRIQISRAKADRDANTPRAKRAKRGGSTGKMTSLAAVLESLDQNKKLENYSLLPAETFAMRVAAMTDLFNPDFRAEWLMTHETCALFEACHLVEDLGFPEIAERLHDFEPYKTWADRFYAREEDHPDHSPEIDLYQRQGEWLEDTDAWRKVFDEANAHLERTYPWEEDGQPVT